MGPREFHNQQSLVRVRDHLLAQIVAINLQLTNHSRESNNFAPEVDPLNGTILGARLQSSMLSLSGTTTRMSYATVEVVSAF